MTGARVLPLRTAERFEEGLLRGLRLRPKSVPSSYLYDDEGSRLFRRIMQLPDYYLSRAELEILTGRAPELAAALTNRSVVVADLGAGDGSKTRVLLDALAGSCGELVYAPIDLSRGALAELGGEHLQHAPEIPLHPLCADFASGLLEVRRSYPGFTRLALLLGSNIGNFTRNGALALLGALSRSLGVGDLLLVGFDLLKDPEVLRRAYDDDQGLTAQFNLNVLLRMNRELGADFDVAAFRHYACFDPIGHAMESYLISTRDQAVTIGRESIRFFAWESLKTEISCKYREADVRSLARDAGLTPVAWFYDSERRFVDTLFRVEAESG
jgi:L-histidine Nalpha-methyltransferase